MAVRLLVLAFVVACGGSYGSRSKTTANRAPARGIVAAALPYSILDGRTGRQVDKEAFWAQVAGSRVVCVGEEHNNPHHHWFQLETVSELVKRRPGGKLALGMEMFQRPFQGVLDDYAARRIDASALLSRSGYEERWSYDFNFYAPTIDKAREAGAALLALNTARELTKKVVREGLAALTPDEKKQVPELVLDDTAHRAWFDATMEEMGGHGHGHPTKAAPEKAAPENAAPEPAAPSEPPADATPAKKMPSMDAIYTAQVLWDESMADGAARWAKAQPQGVLVLLAGNGHCHDTAIVKRVKRRGVDRVISVMPVLDTQGRVAEELAKPKNDFIVVLEVPREATREAR